MAVVFNKRFWKAFVITLVVIQLLAIVSVVFTHLDQSIMHDTPLSFAFKFYLRMSILLLPASLCCAISVSSFVSFRYASISRIKDFFKYLGLGFVCFLVLAIGIYMYDWNVQPQIQLQSMEMLWEIKTRSTYPDRIEDKSNQSSDFYRKPTFENTTLSVLSSEKIRSASDSVKREQQHQIEEIGKLLAVLPFELAEEAYQSYNLEQTGIEFQYAKTVELDSDSLIYIQQELLYEEAISLSENVANLAQYKAENYKRTINAVYSLFSFLLFATLGYFLKNKSLTKIFGIIAIVLLSIYMLHSTTQFMESYFKKIIRSAQYTLF